MHINNIVFVPQMSTPSANQTGIVMSGGANGGNGGAYGHHGGGGNVNAPNIYHLRQMASYQQHQQQQQQQQQRFLSPHHGYSYYHQGPRHFYNHNYPLMNHRPPGPSPQLPPTHGGFNTMWSKNNNNMNNIGQSPLVYQQQQYNYKKSLINNAEMSLNNKIEKSAPTPPTTTTSNNKNNNNNKKEKEKPTETKENISEISIKDNKNNNNNEEIIFEKPPQKQQKSENTLIDPVWNIKKTSMKQSTTFSKLKRSDSKSSTKSTNAPLKIVNKDIKNLEQPKIKNDTMQRNSSKASHTSTKSHHNKEQHNLKNDSSDSGLSTNGHHHHPHHHHHHHNTSSSSCSSTTAKQRKSRSSSKRQDAAVNTSNASTANGQKRRGSSGFTVNDWLQNDMYCYERRFISSCVEDNMISRHNPAHRNSTSSEAAGSDDLNSSSSNEDLCTAYIIQTKSAKKSTKSRQKRQQKRKQLGANGNNSSSINTAAQPMDIDEESKENLKPSNGGKQTSSAAINLRKQCTKAAALKAVLNNTKLTKCSSNALTTSASNSSVCSSLSSASSTSSINSSSSASSSPTHSANTSPTASPTASKRNNEHLKKASQSLIPPLRQFSKLNLSEHDFVQQMRRYLIDPSLLRVYGFPVESVHHEGCIEIYKCLPKHLAEEAVTKDNQRHHRHFYGRKKSNVVNAYDGLYSGSSSQQWYLNASVDSGHGSGDSSPRFTDSDSSEMGEDDSSAPIMAFYTPDGVYQIFSEYYNSVEKQCVRCSKMFQVNDEGEYLTFDSCSYHWGKLNNAYNGKCYVNIYSCCQGEELSEGCSQHPLHVWNGAVVGINGPYADFVHTQPKERKHHKHPKIYAIDCEMSYTGLGLEVTKVTVVGYDGSLVYEHFVRPQADIIDYNTRFSGIAEKDLSTDSNNSIKTFAEVQQDLLNLFDADTILIGHGLDNDLRVLRLVHKTIVDTSLVFNHSTGYPYRRSLKNLTKSFLKRDIQCGDMGHSSFEDSRACLELMMWKVRKDLRHWSYQ